LWIIHNVRSPPLAHRRRQQGHEQVEQAFAGSVFEDGVEVGEDPMQAPRDMFLGADE
jgi:hypothetical protein